jgi:hypothetical protein
MSVSASEESGGYEGLSSEGGHGHGQLQQYGELPESAVMEFAGGSDEMLMTLLAGQAAVDCEDLAVGGWEEVDTWKKVGTELDGEVYGQGKTDIWEIGVGVVVE